ncbi:hypothetical protein ACO1O0_003566 [Amphichorda felina]
MKFTILAALGAILGTAAAVDQAIVINDCDKPIYVQSFPYDGSAPGALTTVQPGKRFTETQRATGSTVKIATTKTLSNPLFFGYSSTAEPNYVYYELSTEFGNPFADEHNILNPGTGCEKFDCEANDEECYSTPDMKKVYGCPKPATLYTRVCA